MIPEAEVAAPEEITAEQKEVLEVKRSKFPERLLIRAGHALSLFFALLLLFYAFTIKSRARIFRKDYHLWTNTSKIAPYDAVAHNAIGGIHKRRGLVRWAKMAFGKAVEVDPNFIEARNNFGTTLGMSQQYDSALVQIKEAIRLDPEYAEAYNSLGVIYGEKTEYDSAIVAFKRAIELDSTHYFACKNLGFVYADLEDFPEALKYFEKALKLAPNDREAEAIKNEIKQIRVRGYR